VLGLLVSVFLVRDTREHVKMETEEHPPEPSPLTFREIFARTPYGDRNLFASQAGLLKNLNAGMSWGIFALFFANFGLSVGRIGVLKAVYPAVCGILQVFTEPLSDRWGQKGLILAVMWTAVRSLSRDHTDRRGCRERAKIYKDRGFLAAMRWWTTLSEHLDAL
jgi:hypothetical protein